MRKNFTLLLIPMVGVVIILMSYASGSPGGKSGSPGDGGSSCVQCHAGVPNPASNWISSNIPFTGYVPGNTYTITLTGTHSGVVKFGFELTAEDDGNAKVGTFILTDPVQTKFTNGNTAVTHTSSGTAPAGGTKTWTVDWTAPAAGTGDIGFYAACNAANGNGTTSGDVIYTTSTFVSEDVANPEIVSIAPDNAEQGESFTATITGNETSWTGSPSVSLSNSTNPLEIIEASAVSVISNTELHADFDIPSDATNGLWDVHADNLVLEEGFEVYLSTGISVLSFSKLEVYPNPTDGLLNITISESADIQLWNITGSMIHKVRAHPGSNQLDLSNKPAGTYFLQIVEDRKVEQVKIIVR